MRDENVEMTGEADTPAEVRADSREDAAAAVEIREKPDAESDPLGEAGWYLEHERLQRGMSLEQAGEGCGVHPYHLEAIELGDMTCLPERREALGMIGAYAQFLGFDPEPLVQHYGHYLPAPPLAADVRHPANPAPLSSAKILAFARLPRFNAKRYPGGAGGLVASVAAAVLLFGAASYMMMPGSSTRPADPALDLSQSEYPAPPPPPGADPMPTASTNSDTADVTVGDEPMPTEETQTASAGEDSNDLEGTGLDGISALIEKSVPQSAKAGAPKPVASNAPAANGAREFGADNGESRLTLKAKAPVWVRIEDSNGNVVMTQMLMKGDTYRVPNRDGLVVIARDGGLLTYVIDGKEKGILGTPGEILVGRSLDIKSFES